MPKKSIPNFKTEAQEAEFWDVHSPLDFGEPEAEPLRVSRPKTNILSIRLDRRTRSRLNKLAAEQCLGPSTLARIIVTRYVDMEIIFLPVNVEE